VLAEVIRAVGNTVTLAVAAAIIGFTLGLIFGLIAGYFRETWIDKVATSFAIAGVSEPFNSSYTLEAAGDERTKLAFSFELEELDLAMRPFQKLIRAALQEGAAQTVENLKTLLESPAAQEIRVA